MSLIESYASIILHTGCAIPPINEQEGRKHKLEECRIKDILLKRAYKHQKKLQKTGLTIGVWVHLKDFEDWCDCPEGYPSYGIGKYKHLSSCRYGIIEDFIEVISAPIDQR